ncbi:SagB/ThcOx family dehydrogenase [Nitrospira sp. Nam80]
MNRIRWQNSLLSTEQEDLLWELFHENSKISRYDRFSLTEQQVVERMKELHEALPYKGYPITELPQPLPLKNALDQVLQARASVRELHPSVLTLSALSTILHYAYGETRDNKDTGYVRPFRVVPSGGGLYPLEIYFHSNCIANEQPGIYHYNLSRRNIRLLSQADKTQSVAKAMVYPELIERAALIIFITAIFERSIFKYGDRGYRFIFLEAGHVAQNINHVVTALDLGCVNIGGFYDREIDDILGLDGVTHSTIYMVAIGNRKEPSHGR